MGVLIIKNLIKHYKDFLWINKMVSNKIKQKLNKTIFVPDTEEEYQKIWLILSTIYTRYTININSFKEYPTIYIEDNKFHGTSRPGYHVDKKILTLNDLLELKL